MCKIIGVIPTRLGSRRLPGKPLLQIGGKPVIQWCYEHTCRSQFLQDVKIVCPEEDCEKICLATKIKNWFDIAAPVGKYKNGTERVYSFFDKTNLNDNDIIVNIQGDNAFFDPRIIDEGIFYLLTSEFLDCCTPATMWTGAEGQRDPNIVMLNTKIDITHGDSSRQFFLNPSYIANDFSREGCYRKHVGIYFWRWKGLKRYTQYAPTENEINRSLEQMRWIDNGEKMGVFFTDRVCESINTQKDYERIYKNYVDGLYNALL